MSSALVTVNYAVQAAGGGPDLLAASYSFTLTGTGPVSSQFDLPLFPGRRTVFQGISVINPLVEQGDDFESFNPVFFDPTDATGQLSYLWTVPNAEAGGDFTDVSAAALNQGFYPALADGWGWAGAGAFLTGDNVSATDDLSGYGPGPLFFLFGGAGFTGYGRLLIADNFFAPDDLQSYATGPITVLNGFTNVNGQSPPGWIGSGGFLTGDNLLAADDLQSYAAGAITILNGGAGWAGSGGFV